MTAGRFAIRTADGAYYDTLSHALRSEQELRQHGLLAGQEREAIISRLSLPGPFSILLIPSFECNLRCPHCYVGHLLEKPSGSTTGSTAPSDLISFIRRAEKVVGKIAHFVVVGGEPFLHAAALRSYAESGLPVSVTTNGVFVFEEVKDVLGQLKHLTFSIDGVPEQHNRTRKPLVKGLDAFETTYHNLCRTVECFPDLDVTVQGSLLGDDESDSASQAIRYFALMVAAGVRRDRISLGPCAATINRPATEDYVASVRRETRRFPCCDYTPHKGIVVYGGRIYPTYHAIEESAPIGTLGDSIDSIVAARMEYTSRQMPMLRDSTCMNECRAVGICWGLCSNARHVFKDGRPSTACDRPHKESLVEVLARGGIQLNPSGCDRSAAGAGG